ncbi:MAG: anthranilate synthase component II [Thermonemataceae bacterium]
MKILVVDNYDSFTYNLVHILHELGVVPSVYRNDKITLEAVAAYDKILLSPGPSLPKEAGLTPAIIQQYAPHKPILGVCLGHQAIGAAFGARLHNLTEVLHGLSTQAQVLDPNDFLFQGIPASFQIGHYHSWAIEKASLENTPLEAIAEDEQGQLMAVRHRTYPLRGVQFHPESILTMHGKQLIANWVFHTENNTQEEKNKAINHY